MKLLQLLIVVALRQMSFILFILAIIYEISVILPKVRIFSYIEPRSLDLGGGHSLTPVLPRTGTRTPATNGKHFRIETRLEITVGEYLVLLSSCQIILSEIEMIR